MSKTLASGILAIVMFLVMTVSGRIPQGTGAADRRVTKEQFEQWKKDLNNWAAGAKANKHRTASAVLSAPPGSK